MIASAGNREDKTRLTVLRKTFSFSPLFLKCGGGSYGHPALRPPHIHVLAALAPPRFKNRGEKEKVFAHRLGRERALLVLRTC
jgi:hypothetical protein